MFQTDANLPRSAGSNHNKTPHYWEGPAVPASDTEQTGGKVLLAGDRPPETAQGAPIKLSSGCHPERRWIIIETKFTVNV
ncbi:hypothetical protein P0082_10180 [Candidatus Haliotispira prima]|uniref:Uncharacterized protein n=1 Tax=Candidatus Haliotispira prima TaxID=3034016 RepID=A0ABY8MFR3_9SPIO|nr:hypothetical protein P0082_10180 [Candidatus Haliotispira prima]